jgi:adenine-specific DNA-methyltransferase
LLPRLFPVFERLSDGLPEPRFLDVFAGSGAVSRLARSMGMRVSANDWEPYSEALGSCWLRLRPTDIDRAFGGPSGLESFLGDWNAMHPLSGRQSVPESAMGQPYMARWYAPEHTAAPRLGEERLFYTAENAAFIDRVRTRIEAEYPDPDPGSVGEIYRAVALGAILLEAAVHANTSGVFKAFHRGFGGNGRDALSRILGRMHLEAPILPEAIPAEVFRDDARVFVGRRSADIAYFDPPYNQHQYGSNYHMLNTILRWDGRPMPLGPGLEAELSRKAGIPVDWKETRSRFCVKREARQAIAELLDDCDAASIVFSWNADGHLSGEDMVELLSKRGRLDIVALDYVSYRGGRQSASRSARSREYLFVVDTVAAPRDVELSKRELSDLAARDEAIRSTYDPRRVSRVFGLRAGGAAPDEPMDYPEASTFFRGDLREPSEQASGMLEELDAERRRAFFERLNECACRGVGEELDATLTVARAAIVSGDTAAAKRAYRDAPRLIRKLAHTKYEKEFRLYSARFQDLAVSLGDGRMAARLGSLDELIAMRAK